MLFVNDPTFDQVPPVGGTPALVAYRNSCGEAVVWTPAGDPVALSAFLGDDFVAFEGVVFQRIDGSLVPVSWQKQSVVLVKPPAGHIYTLSAHELLTEYAIVTVPEVEAPAADVVLSGYELMLWPDLLKLARARGFEGANPKKAALVDWLREFDAGALDG